jgi:3-oxoacyl-[acyl-carrier protein] reductase
MRLLITGTRTGIGRYLATHLAEAGHDVIGCSRRPPAKMPSNYIHYDLDLTDAAGTRAMYRSIRKEYGSLDALINNAGTSNMNPFMLTPDEETRRIFELNVFAMLNCTREAVKLLKDSTHEAPSILNLSSVAVRLSIEGQLAYAASKSAVEQATRTLSRELAGINVRVNTIGLPPVRTALTRTVDKAKIDALIARQALKRMCAFEDIAGPVEFLLSGAARFVTGETLYLGGIH